MNLKSRLRQVLAVGSVESLGVIVGGIAGLLIVNVLPKDQYAQYTFLLACSTLMIGISDLGLAHCAMPVVGTRAGEAGWVAGVCRQIFQWRWVMLAGAFLAVGPYWFYSSRSHGWSGAGYWSATLVFVGIVLLLLREHFTNTVVLILGHVPTIARIAAVSYAVRIPLIGVVLLLPIGAWSLTGIAVATALAGATSVWLYQRALHRLAVPQSRLEPLERKGVDRMAWKIARPLMPSAVFFQFQGVIAVFLASLFGTSDMLAEVGAFGRLALVLMVVDRVTGVVLFPALARAPVGARLVWIVTRVHAAYLGAMALVLISAWLGGRWWILLLGEQYRSMEPYVWMVFLSTILLNASGFAFRTLAVRGLTAKQSYSIPVVIAVQALYLWLFGAATLQAVLGFNIATALAHFGCQYTLLGARMSQLRA